MIKIDIKKRLHGSHGDMNLEVAIEIKQNEFLSLSGMSGSGKTTFLRVLAGLEDAIGTIEVDKQIWKNERINLAPQKREIGFVFQDYALFSNMSVKENLLYVKNDNKLAKRLLEITELDNLIDRLPNSLSGGQKQRVSLCRAMMNNPKLLLMDEPLSSLDFTMRQKLQNVILMLHKEFGTTTIMVSHDPSEIYKLSSRVIILNQGKVISDGTSKEILLKTKGSQKFSFEGELLEIKKVDVIYIAIVAIGQQLVEIVISSEEKKDLKIGQIVKIGTKAFSPTISY